MATDMTTVTIEGEQETAPKLSTGTSFNDSSNPYFKVTIVFNVK